MFWSIAGLPIVLSVLQIVLLFFVPESPKFLLLKRNNEVDAEKGWFFLLTTKKNCKAQLSCDLKRLFSLRMIMIDFRETIEQLLPPRLIPILLMYLHQ